MTIRVNRYWGQRRRVRRQSMSNRRYLAQKVNRIAKLVGNAEMKHLDYVFTANTPTLNGLVTYISGVAQGDTDITRDGNQIVLRKIEWAFEWSIIPDTGAPDTGAFSNNRLMILKDTQAAGVVITNAQVIDQTAIGETYAPRQIDTTDPKRIVAIVDRKFELVSFGQAGTTASGVDITRGTIMIRGKKRFGKTGMKLSFIGTGAGQTSAGKNALYTLFASDAAQGAAVSGYVRMYFNDS